MSNEAIALLRSIDASLKRLVAQQGNGNGHGGDLADARDLDGKWGDPIVRAKDPRDWSGEPMKGRHFSECPPDYLDLLAQRFDYFAEQETDPKKAKYNRLDASRARGWAARKRSGWQSPAAPASNFDDYSEHEQPSGPSFEQGGSEWPDDADGF